VCLCLLLAVTGCGFCLGAGPDWEGSGLCVRCVCVCVCRSVDLSVSNVLVVSLE
jgi:hypothetical protein